MNLMPDMQQQFKDTRHGSPSRLGIEYMDEHGISCNDECLVEWDKILDKMIFLFREMSEETCRKENPYQKEYEDTLQEFEIKYGIFGEKLEEGKKNKLGRVVHFPSEIPEYKDIKDKYYTEEKVLM